MYELKKNYLAAEWQYFVLMNIKRNLHNKEQVKNSMNMFYSSVPSNIISSIKYPV